MSEFKGTKSEWTTKGEYDITTIEGIPVLDLGCGCCSYHSVNEYDLHLMSKSHKMLEMLKNISKQMEIAWRRYDNGEDYDLEQIFDDIDLEELDNLIKEATELK